MCKICHKHVLKWLVHMELGDSGARSHIIRTGIASCVLVSPVLEATHFWAKNYMVITSSDVLDNNCQSQQSLSGSIWAWYPRVLLLFWWYPICWNAKVHMKFVWYRICVYYDLWLHTWSTECEFLFLFSDTERCQLAFVTFKDAQGAETAVLLSVILSLSLSLIP